ncbi:MAG: GNAT family N-acetyltransferase [Bacteroidota bacterium]
MRIIDMKLRDRNNPNLIIVKGAQEHTIARKLIKEYVDSLDFNLDFQDIDYELEYLNIYYGFPGGLIILAKAEDEFVGVACLKDLGNSFSEIKRMYVKPEFRGKGLGRKILNKIVDEAKRLGFRFVRLDTMPDMKSAIHLFVTKGFYEIEEFGTNKLDGARFLEYKL